MFNESSGLVRIWVNLINAGSYTVEQVPNISNLVSVVKNIIEGGETA